MKYPPETIHLGDLDIFGTIHMGYGMFQLVFQAISTGTMGFHGTSACGCGCSRRNLGCSGSNSRRSGAFAMAPGVALKSGVFTDVEEGFKVPRLQC